MGKRFFAFATSRSVVSQWEGSVLYLRDPKGIDANTHRRFLDELAKLNEVRLVDFGDPEIDSRISQYEMAYQMQVLRPATFCIKLSKLT